MEKLRVLDLFSGIGGFSLGLERTGGFETVAFCEIEDFPRKVLAKHWPDVPCYRDVRELTAERLAADGIAVDVICGGFPCQDISSAGAQAGIDGERSGLWSEYARIIGELRPRYVIVENVADLLHRGLSRVLGDLAALGYDAEWHCIQAADIGAPHIRDRLWILAHPNGGCVLRRGAYTGDGRTVSTEGVKRQLRGSCGSEGALADAESIERRHGDDGTDEWSPDREGHASANSSWLVRELGTGGWAPEPAVARVAHGVPDRLERIKALGNAVVPQIPELIGNAILASLPCPPTDGEAGDVISPTSLGAGGLVSSLRDEAALVPFHDSRG